MQKIIRHFIGAQFRFVLAVMLLMLAACGGGGSNIDVPDAPTSLSTKVSLETFKSMWEGSKPGLVYTASLAGSDTQGTNYTGNITINTYGQVAFEGNQVTRTDATLSLKNLLTGASSGDTISTYYSLDGTFYKSVSGSGSTDSRYGSQFNIPGTLQVTSGANIGSTIDENKSISETYYFLYPDVNGKSKLCISYSDFEMTSTSKTEDDCFYLDASGKPYKYEVTITSYNYHITLIGDFIQK